MKGIVLETNEKGAVVLCDDGTVSKIKNRHYEKGQVVNMNKKIKFMVKAGSIAAALAITTATGFAYTAPATYVSLDVNPSIEYKLNAFDRVISVVAVNDDGEKIVNELDVKNDKISKAVLKTLEKLKEEGYLTEDEYAGIVIAVSNKNEEKSEEITNDIEEELNKDDEEVEEETDLDADESEDEDADVEAEDSDEEDEEDTDVEEDTDDIEIVVEAVGRERVEEARKLNVTPGKLNLVEKLIASTDKFDDINEEQLKELLGLSVKEINKMTQAYKKGIEVEYVFEDDLEEDEEDEATVNSLVEEEADDKDEESNEDEDVIDENNEEDDKENKDKINNSVKEEKENKEKGKNNSASGKEKNN